MICNLIHRQESVVEELSSARRGSGDAPPRAEVQDGQMAQLLTTQFAKHQIYLNPHLKLGEVAETIGTNRTYLSRYFNRVLKVTFFEYVNGLRLDHALGLMKQKGESLASIATMSGFNSYATFRRTFIARFHCSPNEYRDNLQEQ